MFATQIEITFKNERELLQRLQEITSNAVRSGFEPELDDSNVKIHTFSLEQDDRELIKSSI